MRMWGDSSRFFQYQLPDKPGGLNLSRKPGGYSTSINRGSIDPVAETHLGSHAHEFVIFSLVWDRKIYKQRHFFYLGNGHRIPGPAGEAPYKPLDVVSYSIGAVEGAEKPNGQVAEILVFNRALPDGERRKLEDQLFQRYFRPDRRGCVIRSGYAT